MQGAQTALDRVIAALTYDDIEQRRTSCGPTLRNEDVPLLDRSIGQDLLQIEGQMGARGKTLLIRLLSITPADDHGNRSVFFKLNGQTRAIEILDKSVKVERRENRKADKSDAHQVAAPLQGLLSKLMVAPGATVKKAQPLFVIEAMKMETTISAPFDGVVKELALGEGSLVNTGDLVVVMG